MKLKIQPFPGHGSTVFALTGRMPREYLAELQSLLDLKTPCEEFALNLKEPKLAAQWQGCLPAFIDSL